MFCGLLLRSPLARKIYSALLSDPVWADFWPMVAPRIPEIYQVWMKNGFGNWDDDDDDIDDDDE